MKGRFPKSGIRKNAQEFVDADYLDKLSPAEREWYDNFIQSEYGASRKAAKKVKRKDLKELDKANYRRRFDAYNRLDRSIRADKILANLESKEEDED